MLFRLVAVSLVIMGCAYEVMGAKFNCAVTGENIYRCLSKPEQNKTYAEYAGKLNLYNMSAVTFILKKLKTDGCIEKSTWKDIQAWIKLRTPPKPLSAIYNSLTEDQKTTLVTVSNNMNDPNFMEKWTAVNDFIGKKLDNLSKANDNKITKWTKKVFVTCQNVGPR